jgi:hypothetical protein
MLCKQVAQPTVVNPDANVTQKRRREPQSRVKLNLNVNEFNICVGGAAEGSASV